MNLAELARFIDTIDNYTLYSSNLNSRVVMSLSYLCLDICMLRVFELIILRIKQTETNVVQAS